MFDSWFPLDICCFLKDMPFIYGFCPITVVQGCVHLILVMGLFSGLISVIFGVVNIHEYWWCSGLVKRWGKMGDINWLGCGSNWIMVVASCLIVVYLFGA